jgi:phage-related protein
MTTPRTEKPLHWIGSSKKDLLALPTEVIDDFGYALGAVQLGGIRTAKSDMDLIHDRLKLAQQHYKDHHEH